MPEEKEAKTLEMRVAELEDKLSKVTFTEEELAAARKVATAMPAVPAALCVISSCVIHQCIVHQCIIHQCIISQCIQQCIRQCFECSCGPCAVGGGSLGRAGGFGTLGM
jgi:hypothetical protein